MNTANPEDYFMRLDMAIHAAQRAVASLKAAKDAGHGNDTSLMDAVPYLQAALELVK